MKDGYHSLHSTHDAVEPTYIDLQVGEHEVDSQLRGKLHRCRIDTFDDALDKAECRFRRLSQQMSTSAKVAICVPILLSAILCPILLIMQNARFNVGMNDIPTTLKNMPWNPSMLPDYSVLDQVKETGDFSSSLYPNPLGNKVVLLDVDTRHWAISNAANMTQVSYGRLNHYLYAKMHGYHYQYIKAPELSGEIRQTWVKVDAIRRVLQQGYQFVVFTDYDIVFPHMKIPLEWFLDFWNVTPEIILTVGSVPNRTDKYDQYHRHLSINSGFMIVQNAPQALDMLKDWAECPSEVKFPGCAQWKTKYSHEQNAYADYIRYAYPNTTRDIDCDQVTSSEFMKMPNATKCRGTLIQHFWSKKDEVKNAVQASIANLVFPDVVKHLQDEVVSHIE
ncbi:Hypothetical protein D9617_23g005950 [Elsinoe fawcettii]|nr:Hypothetical protein D9617_23g005950 [Elsinoe fawcettii]